MIKMDLIFSSSCVMCELKVATLAKAVMANLNIDLLMDYSVDTDFFFSAAAFNTQRSYIRLCSSHEINVLFG